MKCGRCGGYLLVERDPVTGMEARCLLCGGTHVPAAFRSLPYLGLRSEGQAQAWGQGRSGGGGWERERGSQ